jgi:enoyl-CoA hydratase/carnithine racemase
MSIDFSIDAEIAIITINRPERLNAMDAEHYRALSAAWCRVRDDNGIRAAVVTGAGERAFSTGADIKSFAPVPPPYSDMWLTQRDQLLNRGLEVWKPVIAAVNGLCLGGGMTLLMATDIRVADEHSTFSLAEVTRGLVAGNGGTQRLLSQIPYALAMEMALTGKAIDAETALRWGLINEVTHKGGALDGALRYAKLIATNAPLAVQATKELVIRSRDMDLVTGLRMEQFVNRLLQSTEDISEGADAFSEKRPPNFRGR